MKATIFIYLLSVSFLSFSLSYRVNVLKKKDRTILKDKIEYADYIFDGHIIYKKNIFVSNSEFDNIGTVYQLSEIKPNRVFKGIEKRSSKAYKFLDSVGNFKVFDSGDTVVELIKNFNSKFIQENSIYFAKRVFVEGNFHDFVLKYEIKCNCFYGIRYNNKNKFRLFTTLEDDYNLDYEYTPIKYLPNIEVHRGKFEMTKEELEDLMSQSKIVVEVDTICSPKKIYVKSGLNERGQEIGGVYRKIDYRVISVIKGSDLESFYSFVYYNGGYQYISDTNRVEFGGGSHSPNPPFNGIIFIKDLNQVKVDDIVYPSIDAYFNKSIVYPFYDKEEVRYCIEKKYKKKMKKLNKRLTK